MIPVDNFLRNALCLDNKYDNLLPTQLDYALILRSNMFSKRKSYTEKSLGFTLYFMYNITFHLSNVSCAYISSIPKDYFFSSELNLFVSCFVNLKYITEFGTEKITFDERDSFVQYFVMGNVNFSLYDYRDISFHDSHYEQLSEVKSNLKKLMTFPEKRLDRTREQNIIANECRDIYNRINNG